MEISCTIAYNERLSLTMTQKHSETRSIACCHTTATYPILLLSRWRGSRTVVTGAVLKKRTNSGLDVNPETPSPLPERISQNVLDSFFIRVKLIKVVTADSPGEQHDVIGCLTESSDMFGQANSQSNLEL